MEYTTRQQTMYGQQVRWVDMKIIIRECVGLLSIGVTIIIIIIVVVVRFMGCSKVIFSSAGLRIASQVLHTDHHQLLRNKPGCTIVGGVVHVGLACRSSPQHSWR